MSVRIGVIGAGYWGPNLIRNFSEIPDAQLVAVADLREDRLAHIANRYPDVVTTTRYQDFLKLRLDAVVIATSPPTHYPIATYCLNHGLHVLVEKPLTLTSKHAEDLIALADSKDRVLMVGHVFEYNSVLHALKRIMTSGELGKILYIHTRRLNLGALNPKLSVLWDLGPHDISILRYLLDADPLQVSAWGASFILKDMEEIAVMHMEFPNHVYTQSHMSWLDPCKVREVIVVGDKKMAVYDDVAPTEKIRIYDKCVDFPYTDTYGEFKLQYHHGDVVIPSVPQTEALREECLHFLNCIETGATPLSDGRDGLAVLKVLEAAEASMRNGNGLRTVGMLADRSELAYA